MRRLDEDWKVECKTRCGGVGELCGCVEVGNKEEKRSEYEELPPQKTCKIVLSIFIENSTQSTDRLGTILSRAEFETVRHHFYRSATCSNMFWLRYKYSRHIPSKNSSSFCELVLISCFFLRYWFLSLSFYSAPAAVPYVVIGVNNLFFFCDNNCPQLLAVCN